MLNTFLTICSHRGLELLLPETPDSKRILLDRLSENRHHQQCWRIVLPHGEASTISQMIDIGAKEAALSLANQLALNTELVVPEFAEGCSRLEP